MPAPRVCGLYVAPSAGAPMEARAAIAVTAGAGIPGDRYAEGRGHWSFERRYVSEVTFVEAEVVERIAAALERPFAASQTRRNVVTAGVRLAALIGARFAIGTALFAGERPCDPCAYLDTLLGLPARALLGSDGGLRARVLRSGRVTAGDSLTVLPESVDNAAARS